MACLFVLISKLIDVCGIMPHHFNTCLSYLLVTEKSHMQVYTNAKPKGFIYLWVENTGKVCGYDCIIHKN